MKEIDNLLVDLDLFSDCDDVEDVVRDEYDKAEVKAVEKKIKKQVTVDDVQNDVIPKKVVKKRVPTKGAKVRAPKDTAKDTVIDTTKVAVAYDSVPKLTTLLEDIKSNDYEIVNIKLNQANPIVKIVMSMGDDIFLTEYTELEDAYEVDENRREISNKFYTIQNAFSKIVSLVSFDDDSYLQFTWRNYVEIAEALHVPEIDERAARFLLSEPSVRSMIDTEIANVMKSASDEIVMRLSKDPSSGKDEINTLKSITTQLETVAKGGNNNSQIVVFRIPEPDFYTSYENMLTVLNMLYRHALSTGNGVYVKTIDKLKDDVYIKKNKLFCEIEKGHEELPYYGAFGDLGGYGGNTDAGV